MDNDLYDLLWKLYCLNMDINNYLSTDVDLLKGFEPVMTKENMETIKSYYYLAYRQYWGIPS